MQFSWELQWWQKNISRHIMTCLQSKPCMFAASIYGHLNEKEAAVMFVQFTQQHKIAIEKELKDLNFLLYNCDKIIC